MQPEKPRRLIRIFHKKQLFFIDFCPASVFFSTVVHYPTAAASLQHDDAPAGPSDPAGKGVVVLLVHLPLPIPIPTAHRPESFGPTWPVPELQEVLPKARGLILVSSFLLSFTLNSHVHEFPSVMITCSLCNAKQYHCPPRTVGRLTTTTCYSRRDGRSEATGTEEEEG